MAKTVLTKEDIRKKVTTNAEWTERAVVVLYEYQTDDEQNANTTKHSNEVGFNGFDASILSDFARWIKSGRHLSVKQLALAQKKIGKYSGQLLRIAQEKTSNEN